MKQCLCCSIDKRESEFTRDKSRSDDLCVYCKDCSKEKARKRYLQNPNPAKKRSREHYASNVAECSSYGKDYYNKNKEKIKSRVKEYRDNNKESIAVTKSEWARNNPGRMRELRKKSDLRNPDICRIRRRIKDMVRRTLKAANVTKSSKSSDLVGYSPVSLKVHIESLFVDGMNWDNYGLWHIDHIKPIKAFIDEGNFNPADINALSNLQPLWAKDNLSKGAKWTSP